MASSQVSETSVNADYLNEIEAARRDLRAIITFERHYAAYMLTLAWRDALTYDAKTNTGGPNGSIRRKQELQHRPKIYLETAVDLCETVKKKHPKITYADLYQLAGVVAVEATGGPTIEFIPGRNDSNKSLEEGRLPDPTQGAEHQRQVFYRMGLSDKDIVAFSGACIVASATATAASSVPVKFDNSCFTRIIKDESDGSLTLPRDKAFVEDPVFWHYVQLYAKDEEAFFRDYAETHKKLSELGFTAPLSCKNVTEKWLMGVALVCCVMALVRLCELCTRVG